MRCAIHQNICGSANDSFNSFIIKKISCTLKDDKINF